MLCEIIYNVLHQHLTCVYKRTIFVKNFNKIYYIWDWKPELLNY